MLDKPKFTTEQHMIIIIATLFIFAIWYIVSDYYKVEGFAGQSRDVAEKRIDDDDWTFFDKVLYGGLGYGNICLPTHLFRVILTIIFPPLGILIKHVKMIDDFPWIDLTEFIMNIGEFIQATLLTAFFYIPGLIYSLNQLKCGNDGNCS
mgnify:FL=1|jgi:uncharacterized membrane protein YqaE (UPF0057 family)